MKDMLIREGKSVYHGIAIGRVFIFRKAERMIKKEYAKDISAEVVRYETAKEKAITQLKELYEKVLYEMGEAEALLFEAHQMMLEDEDFLEAVMKLIEVEGVVAEYAVSVACEQFVEMFSSMEDAYMRERAVDIKDVSWRVISILNGTQQDFTQIQEPVIIFAQDLAPSETVQFDKKKILALVTQKGSVNSHTAILARTMNIPSIVSADIVLDRAYHGEMAIIDGNLGKIYINPDDKTLAKMQEKKELEQQKRNCLLELKGEKTVTKSGRKVLLYSNIGSIEDIDSVLENDAEGIGLFRSEFLYLGRDSFPSEAEQFEAYRTVLSRMGKKKVIIRTLDIGADKQADYFGLEKEENPALGLRAIRICLMRKEVFKTQLRALYRASVYGNLAIMFPMIISLKEVFQIKEMIAEVTKELESENIAYAHVELGIMIETPAGAMISDLLAQHVDFFSIGTNDLSQYTLAIDRQNQLLEPFFDAHHEAVLRFIEMTITNAHRHGAWCGICGELAADMELTEKFLKMGIDELSVSPAYTLALRKLIREMD